MKHRLLFCTAILGALPACAPGGASSETQEERKPFDFQTMGIEDVQVRVLLDGQPAPGALVFLADSLRPSSNGPGTTPVAAQHYLTLRADANGVAAAPLRLAATVDELDVVVSYPGAAGPYTHESLRSTWGPFAPASRTRVPRGRLDDVQIDLEEMNR